MSEQDELGYWERELSTIGREFDEPIERVDELVARAEKAERERDVAVERAAKAERERDQLLDAVRELRRAYSLGMDLLGPYDRLVSLVGTVICDGVELQWDAERSSWYGETESIAVEIYETDAVELQWHGSVWTRPRVSTEERIILTSCFGGTPREVASRLEIDLRTIRAAMQVRTANGGAS